MPLPLPQHPEKVRVDITIDGVTHTYELVHDDRQPIDFTAETITETQPHPDDPYGIYREQMPGQTRATIQVSGLLKRRDRKRADR